MAAESQQRPNTIKCENCGEEITDPHFAQKFCSTECRDQYRRNTGSSICEYCGEEFTHWEYVDRTYCSVECQALGRKAKSPDRVITICENCGTEIEHRPSTDRTYCSRGCYIEAKQSDTENEHSESESIDTDKLIEEMREIVESLSGQRTYFKVGLSNFNKIDRIKDSSRHRRRSLIGHGLHELKEDGLLEIYHQTTANTIYQLAEEDHGDN